VANTYLEGTYSRSIPTSDIDGLRKLFRQFSFPGGIPSHAAPETPGSMHEGGELGYALTHAYGAAFDNPDLIGIWTWAGTEVEGTEPDVVMACAGEVPTLETLAAVNLLREGLPDLKIRVVNVVDLMTLQPKRRIRTVSAIANSTECSPTIVP
jgi:phosphoketolase